METRPPESMSIHSGDSWDADSQPNTLRLMCSYGGHIVPRPHDKTLSYVGGDTRIILLHRHSSLSHLRSSLSKTLLHNHPFSLRYKLPNHDLDSLISLSTDEDLHNMVDEYDRLYNGSNSKPPRIRLFLFPNNPSPNIHHFLLSAKSHDWFYDALNGNPTPTHPSLSDTSSVNRLLGLDDDSLGNTGEGSKLGGSASGNNNSIISQDLHSVPDYPMHDTTSSFGSTSSSLSGPHLPPIKVHVEENPKVGGLGIEDQFQQLNVMQEEAGAGMVVGRVVSGAPMVVVSGEYANRVSDDERSDHAGYRKQAQLQLQSQQIQMKQKGATDLPSPDSVSSEASVMNPLSRQRQVVYQEPIIQHQSANTSVTGNHPDQNGTKVPIQPQVQESGYAISGGGQYDHHRQQFVQLGNQYVPAGAVPLASYYPIYPSQHQHQSALDQQYPVYYVPARPPPQGNNIPRYSEPGPTLHQTPLANVPCSKPERAYRATAGVGPQLVQISYGQLQPQYAGYTEVQVPSQATATSSSSAHDFADSSHAPQVYYTRQLDTEGCKQQMRK